MFQTQENLKTLNIIKTFPQITSYDREKTVTAVISAQDDISHFFPDFLILFTQIKQKTLFKKRIIFHYSL